MEYAYSFYINDWKGMVASAGILLSARAFLNIVSVVKIDCVQNRAVAI